MGDNSQPDENVQASPPGVSPTHRAEPTTGDNFELWKSVHVTFPGSSTANGTARSTC